VNLDAGGKAAVGAAKIAAVVVGAYLIWKAYQAFTVTGGKVWTGATETMDSALDAVGVGPEHAAAAVQGWSDAYDAHTAAKRLGLSTLDELRMTTTIEGQARTIALAKAGKVYVAELDTRPAWDVFSSPPDSAFALPAFTDRLRAMRGFGGISP
jgi:hypothetical protein